MRPSIFPIKSRRSTRMRFLLDQGLPRGAARLLVEAGHDAVHVGDLRMAAAADEMILRFGDRDDRVVVTLDADFHMLLANSGAAGPPSFASGRRG